MLDAIWRYVDTYDYIEVRRLFGRFGYDVTKLGRNKSANKPLRLTGEPALDKADTSI